MKRQFAILLGALFVTLALAGQAFAQQLAFPTAEGFGRFAKGGRGGDVCIVTTLAATGAGSLRNCIDSQVVGAPRTITFEVTGNIIVDSAPATTPDALNLNKPFVTIAGQTSPGGIALTNQGGDNLNPNLYTRSNDIIVRHIRFRPGPSPTTSDNVDAFNMESCSRNVIFDHVSASWGTDELVNITGNNGTSGNGTQCSPYNVTVQWSLVYESLRNSTHSSSNHSRPVYLGYGSGDITWVRNAAGSSQRRLPNTGTIGQFDWVNSLVYNASQYQGELYNRHGDSHHNWIASAGKIGPSSFTGRDRHLIDVFLNGGESKFDVYLDGNLDVNRPTDTGDEKLVMDPKDWAVVRTSPSGYGVLSVAPANITSAEQAYWDILDFGGAGGNIGKRDTADARWVNDVRNCTGAIIDTIAQGGGMPTLTGGAPPADIDRDGMSDAWEAARGLSSASAADRNGDLDGDGYTNLEEYLNELAGDQNSSGVLINRIGTGTGSAINITCGRTLTAANQPIINNFTVQGPNPWPAVKPGDTLTITFDGDRKGGTCKAGGYVLPGGPQACVGSTTVVAPAVSTSGPLSFDFILTGSNGLVDHENIVIFNTPTGAMPTVVPTLTCTPTTVNLGQTVSCTWVVNTARSAVASECIAAGPGGWSGIKPVIGLEVFAPLASGNYTLTCAGLAGTGSASRALTVNGTPPPPPPLTPVLTIAATDAVKNEGNSGTTNFTFTVSRTVSTTGVSSASYAVSGNTASPATGPDFVSGALPSGSVSFADTEASKVITIAVAGETLFEANEGFTVTLSAPVSAALGATTTANGTINNDDAAPPPPVVSIAANAASVAEGNLGTTAVGFMLTRTGDISGASSVVWTAGAGAPPAVDAADFPPGGFPSGTASFASNQASASVAVNVNGDTANEADEALTVTLSAPSGATIGTGTANVSVLNDDPVTPPPPVFQEGAKVEANRSPVTEVNASPGGAVIGTQPVGTDGEIVGCSKTQDGQVWWKVNFATGRDGWAQQRYLQLCPLGVCP